MPEIESKDQITEQDRQDWNLHIVGAYKRTAIALFRVSASLLGLWVFSAFVGWIRADSYFSSFGASWLTGELNIIELLAFSFWPIVALGVGLVVTFHDFSVRYHGKGMMKLWGVMLVVFIATVVLYSCTGDSSDYARTASRFWMMFFPVSAFIGFEFAVLVQNLSKHNFQWSSGNVWTIFLLLIWYLGTVGALGHAEGRRDASPVHTKLDLVEKHDGETLRLVLNKEGNIYAAKVHDNEYPKVKLVNSSEVKYIYKAPNKWENGSEDASSLPSLNKK